LVNRPARPTFALMTRRWATVPSRGALAMSRNLAARGRRRRSGVVRGITGPLRPASSGNHIRLRSATSSPPWASIIGARATGTQVSDYMVAGPAIVGTASLGRMKRFIEGRAPIGLSPFPSTGNLLSLAGKIHMLRFALAAVALSGALVTALPAFADPLAATASDHVQTVAAPERPISPAPALSSSSNAATPANAGVSVAPPGFGWG
jgi:hypothetical protein